MVGRPRSPRAQALSRAVIVRAALDVADVDGLAALSMRTVAKRLDVEAMSLYNHVRNKDDMLDGLVDLVFAEFYSPTAGSDWGEEMRERSRSGRRAMSRHPWAIGLMDSRRNAGLETLRHHDAVIGCLRAAGFSLALTGHAFALLDAHLYGFVVQEQSMAFEGTDDLAELGTQMLERLPEGELSTSGSSRWSTPCGPATTSVPSSTTASSSSSTGWPGASPRRRRREASVPAR